MRKYNLGVVRYKPDKKYFNYNLLNIKNSLSNKPVYISLKYFISEQCRINMS